MISLTNLLNGKRSPHISVVIPAYNSVKTIAHAIESVQKQKGVNVEIIVVNDASTDNTAEVVQKLQKKDSRIRLISHDINKKVAQARNTGIDAAKAEWIAFLDADDEWLPEKLISQYREAVKSPTPENVFCFCYFMKKNSGVVTTPTLSFGYSQQYKPFDPNDLDDVRIRLVNSDIWFGGSSSLFAHKKALEKAGGYDPGFGFCEDNFLVLKHILNKGEKPLGEVRVVPEHLMIYTDSRHKEKSDYYNAGVFPLKMLEQKCYVAQHFGSPEAKKFIENYSHFFAPEDPLANPEQIKKAMHEICKNAPCQRGFACGLKGEYCKAPSP